MCRSGFPVPFSAAAAGRFRRLVFPVRIFYLCRMTTELCAYSVEACETARRAGVTRVELCASPYEGGTTPSAAAIRMARRIGGLQLSVMVRPRGGDFLYSDTEFRQMLEEVRFARECGADGVVFGVLTPPRRAGRRAAYGCPGRRGGADADHLSPGVRHGVRPGGGARSGGGCRMPPDPDLGGAAIRPSKASTRCGRWWRRPPGASN